MVRLCIFVLIILALISCQETSDNKQPWKIGGDYGMSKIIVNQDEATDVKICSDKYKDIGFSTTINIHYDGKTYYRLIEGLCVTIHAKKASVRFATPSSGKRAEGTFEILESSSK